MDRDTWCTEPTLFAALDARFGFGLDAAAADDRSLCKRYFSADRSALGSESWSAASGGRPVFCNPPFSQLHGPGGFVRRARIESSRVPVVLLVPATRAVEWWSLDVFLHAAEVWDFRGRLGYMHPVLRTHVPGVRFESAVIVYDVARRGEYRHGMLSRVGVPSPRDRDHWRRHWYNPKTLPPGAA